MTNYLKSDRVLKVAVLGCGKMGRNHIRVINILRGAELVAVSDPMIDKQAIDSICPEKVERFHTPEELLERINPEVVHICTPPDTHADLAKLAINHGANVYVEKPFAFRRGDAASVLSLSKEKGVKVCAGHQVLFEHAARSVHDSLKELGKIVHVESYFSFRQVRRSITPVDQLIDILPHPVYLLLHILNEGSDERINGNIEIKSIDVNARGDVHGILNIGNIYGTLIVTLRGRPVESYLRIVGTNGSYYVDFVRGTLTKLVGPGASAFSAILNPYIQAKQILLNTTKAFASRALRKQKSYPGLYELIEAFYRSILNDTQPPLTSNSIIDTVRICHTIGTKLKEVEVVSDKIAKSKFQRKESELAPIDPDKGMVLVTGGTGFLGSTVASELISKEWPVRIVARHIPSFEKRIPGAEYTVADLGDEISHEIVKGVETVVHCAAETAGGKEAHEHNSVNATRNIISSGSEAGIKKFINISSLAVLKPGREVGRSLDERSPLDTDNLSRGPYVWGKAKSESLSSQLSEDLGISVKIIRPGPLVNFNDFEPPGRLGREIGPIFVAIGKRKNGLSVCDVHTAAKVIRYYVDDFENAPSILNLIEAHIPSRSELLKRLLKKRHDLSAFWIPPVFLKILSPPLKILQLLLIKDKKPIDIYDAFSSEEYNTELVTEIINRTQKA